MANYHNKPYIFEGVSEDEFAFLKARELHIKKEAERDLVYFERFTPEDIIRFKKTGLSFDYIKDPQSQGVLYLFFGRGEKQKPILNRIDCATMSGFERKIFSAMRNILEESLRGEGLRKRIKEE